MTRTLLLRLLTGGLIAAACDGQINLAKKPADQTQTTPLVAPSSEAHPARVFDGLRAPPGVVGPADTCLKDRVRPQQIATIPEVFVPAAGGMASGFQQDDIGVVRAKIERTKTEFVGAGRVSPAVQLEKLAPKPLAARDRAYLGTPRPTTADSLGETGVAAARSQTIPTARASLRRARAASTGTT